MKKLFPLLFLVACTETTTTPKLEIATPSRNPYAASGVSDPSFKLPEGSGCKVAVARLKATLDNDLETGHIGKGVYQQMTSDLSSADKTCQAGQDGAASAQIRNIRVRNGYPAS